MSRVELQTYAAYLKEAKNLYEEIGEIFEDIEQGKITINQDRFQFVKISNDIKRLVSLLTKVNIAKIKKDLKDDEMVEKIKDKIDMFYEGADYIKKRLLAYEYMDDLFAPVKNYMKRFTGDPSLYKKWADNENEFVRKFIAALTHPDEIERYKPYIRRMAMGTMSQREFNKIFEATKHKMIPQATGKFESFKEYKS